MIKRIWHGWTTPENADRYERLLREEVFPGIAARGVAGYRGFEILRREPARSRGASDEDHVSDEVEFVTILTFDSIGAVAEFAGDDLEAAYVPPAARRVLARFDERTRHYEVRERSSSQV